MQPSRSAAQRASASAAGTVRTRLAMSVTAVISAQASSSVSRRAASGATEVMLGPSRAGFAGAGAP